KSNSFSKSKNEDTINKNKSTPNTSSTRDSKYEKSTKNNSTFVPVVINKSNKAGTDSAKSQTSNVGGKIFKVISCTIVIIIIVYVIHFIRKKFKNS
ncbi:hypothetical protein JWF66_19565, partial [Clostridium botulinum]|nr:hypothetical protein [Clostridium botulinum]